MNKNLVIILAGLLCLGSTHLTAQKFNRRSKAASKYTIEAYNNVRYNSNLDFNSTLDSQNAHKGILATWPDLKIPKYNSPGSDDNSMAWNMEAFGFLNSHSSKDAPYTVNPSLWREAKLNYIPGIFEVTDGIYQARGFDLANTTYIKGKTGWILVDPLGSPETSRAGFDSLISVLRAKGMNPFTKISAIIFTHSHIDHYGGILGVYDLLTNKSKVYAPSGFLEHAISENTIAGNAMGRRATYMYGALLLRDSVREVDAGLGKGITKGTAGIIDRYVSLSGSINKPQTLPIDNVDVEFWSTPGAEAPVEVMFYFPKYKAICASEEVTHTMHNVYSLRGAKVRDALVWSKFIDSTLSKYGDKADMIFASHHWPVWGKKDLGNLMVAQRDLYRYIHDQSMRLANQGATPVEIATDIKLPESLDTVWANRGYYGTLSHNSKSVYNYYLGWFDGNPANLNPLPPREAGLKYVEFMGGYHDALQKAYGSFRKGEYRWAAMVLNHIVFAYPDSMQARYLLADAYEQMGYQSESGPWRNFYLTGAQELRFKNVIDSVYGKNNVYPTNEVMNAMPLEQYLDFMAIHLVPDTTRSSNYNFSVHFSKPYDKNWMLISLQNNTIHYKIMDAAPTDRNIDATITLPRDTMNVIITRGPKAGAAAMKAAVKNKTATISGRHPNDWHAFIGMLNEFKFWFDIVTP